MTGRVLARIKVRAIRAAIAASGPRQNAAIARQFGVSRSVVSQIGTGRNYADVPGEPEPYELTERTPWPEDSHYLVGPDGTVVGPSGDLMTPWHVDAHPYLLVSMGRRAGIRLLHVVVCETFHGPRPPGRQAAHENGVHHDCRAENLSWKTPTDNATDKFWHGTQPLGVEVVNAKLNDEMVRAMRIEHQTGGVSFARLGARYGVCADVARKAVQRETWRHVL